MSQDRDALRLAEVFRLSLGGLTSSEIADQVSDDIQLVGVDQVEKDLALIASWQEQYNDPEKIRTSLALDLDSLFKSILVEVQSTRLNNRPASKAEFYKQAREVLLQKALLFGLNTQNVNVNQKSKLWTVIQELRADATQLETEANYPALAEPQHLPVAIAAPAGLYVESDLSTGR